MSRLEEGLRAELDRLRQQDLYRCLLTIQSPQAEIVEVGGRRLVNFCSNNYLGLANRSELREAAVRATELWGVGAGASRLVSGDMGPHRELERAIAEFEGTEDALLFPTGYMANLGTIAALVGPGDEVILDKLCHASIIDGARLSGARIRTYRHCDMNHLRELLVERKGRRVLVVTDGVFSVDGDIAPLRDLYELTREFDAVLMLDDAHGTGVIGEQGRGVAELCDLGGRIDVLVGTLSKAVGALGGFVAGTSGLTDYLRNSARSFIYTTALPPATCAAAREGLRLIGAEPDLRRRLWDNVRSLVAGMSRIQEAKGETGERQRAVSAIVPIAIGDSGRAVRIADRLMDAGFLVRALRPPTVPHGTSRLRVTLMATHTKDQIGALVEWLRAAADQCAK